MSASHVPVSPGSIPPMTDSVGNGSAYDLECDLAAQMDRNELGQAGISSMFPPDEFGGSAPQPPGGEYGDDEEYEVEGMSGWGAHPVTTFDASVYTAHQDFVRAASQYMSPMGYDVHSPSDWAGDATPAAHNLNASSALGFAGESAIDAFNRQSAMGVSSMGYDPAMPDASPGLAFTAAFSPNVAPEVVPMRDSTKRGRADRPTPAASCAGSPPERSASQLPAPSDTGAASSSQSAPAPPPSTDAVRLATLTAEVADLQSERAGFQARMLASEATAQASIQCSEASVLAFKAQLAEWTRQAEVQHADVVRRHAEQLAELRAEAADYRTQSEAQVAHVAADLTARAEARHAEALSTSSAALTVRAPLALTHT